MNRRETKLNICQRELSHVTFKLLTDEQILMSPAGQITSSETSSLIMGTTNFKHVCLLCDNPQSGCMGHHGYTYSPYPVFRINKDILAVKIAKVICFKCGKLMVTKDKLLPRGATNRLATYVDRMNVKKHKNSEIGEDVKVNIKCPHCKAIHPHVKSFKDKSHSPPITVIIQTITYDKRGVVTIRQLFNHELKAIFDRVSNDTVVELGYPLRSHPRHLMGNAILVPANTVRPSMSFSSRNNNRNHDLTTQITNIIKMIESLPRTVPKVIDPDMALRYNLMVQAHHNMLYNRDQFNKSGSASPHTSVTESWVTKQGRWRLNLQGARVFQNTRSVIKPDPYIRPNEVLVPITNCKDMPKNIVVTENNYDDMLIIFNNGLKYRPRCLNLIKANGAKYIVDGNPDLHLEVGDTVVREMMEGDTAMFNRQPTLHMLGMRCVNPIPTMYGKTISSSLLSVGPYNADYDGDEMHLTNAQSAAAQYEIDGIANTKDQTTYNSNGAPTLAMPLNYMWGANKMTRGDMMLHPQRAMHALSNVDKTLRFDTDKPIIGRDLMSAIIPTCVNLDIDTADPMLPYEQSKEDTHVVIKRGVIKSGVFNGHVVGKKRTSIIHQVTHKLGSAVATDFAYDMQQLTGMFLHLEGATCHLKDFQISERARKELQQQKNANIQDSIEYAQKWKRGELTLPGNSPHISYEIQQQEKLTMTNNYATTIADIDPDNNIFHMVNNVGKGNTQHILNMTSASGQQTIDGMRIGWDKPRSTPYAMCFSDHPSDKGYVESSLIEGLSVKELTNTNLEAGVGLTHKLLSVSQTGAGFRRSVKNLEDLITSHLRQVLKSGELIQPLYGGSGIDISKIIHEKVHTIMCSTAKLRENYLSSSKNKKLDGLMCAEFDRIVEDREFVRRSKLKVERQSMMPKPMKPIVHVGFSIQFIIDDVVQVAEEQKMESKLDEAAAMTRLEEFCADLRYVFTNRFAHAAKRPSSSALKAATNPAQIVLRSRLCLKELRRQSINNDMLELILERVFVTYKQALIPPGVPVGIIAAQALIHDYTQFMLDAHLRSGIGGTNVSDKWRGLEIINLRTTDKMKNPRMTLHVKAKYAKNKNKVREIANGIRMMKFGRFVVGNALIYVNEQFGKPVHPTLSGQVAIIQEMGKVMNTPTPTNLSSWVIRFKLDIDKMLLSDMTIDTIIMSLSKYPIHPVYTTELHTDQHITCYLLESPFTTSMAKVEELESLMLDDVVRGITNVTGTVVMDFNQTVEDEDGALIVEKVFAIITQGTNLIEALTHADLDRTRSTTNSIHEVMDVFGINFARRKIIYEMRDAFEGHSFAHYNIFADLMTFAGQQLTGITPSGSEKRGGKVFDRASYGRPVDVLTNAAVKNRKTKIEGISSSLTMGSPINGIGQMAYDLVTDESVVAKYVEDVEGLM